MILPYIIVGLISSGQIQSVFAKSLVHRVAMFPEFGFGEVYQHVQVPQNQVYNNVIVFMGHLQELLNVQVDKYNIKTEDIALSLGNIWDEIEQSFLVVKTKTTRRHRRKRYLHSHHTLCHFKICSLGRKRHLL